MSTSWNPLDKGPGTSLTGPANLAASRSSSGNELCRAVHPLGSGKYFWSYKITATNNNECNGVGIATASASTGGYCGHTAASLGYYSDTGNVYGLANDTVYTTLAAPLLNGNIDVAVDTIIKKLWFRLNNGGWLNAAIGSQNPATGLGGISLAALSGTPIYPAFTLADPGNASLAAFSSGSWPYAAPAGFTEVNPSAPAKVRTRAFIIG